MRARSETLSKGKENSVLAHSTPSHLVVRLGGCVLKEHPPCGTVVIRLLKTLGGGNGSLDGTSSSVIINLDVAGKLLSRLVRQTA